jgi:hypothetical protein
MVRQLIEDLKGKMLFRKLQKLQRVNQWLDGFNRGMPALKALGLSLQSFHVSMGLPPKIEAVLVGSIEAIDKDKIQKLLEIHQANTFLIGILKGLQTASNLQGLVGEVGLRGIEVPITIGIPPRITVRFQRQEAARPDAQGTAEERRTSSPGLTAA